MSQVNINLGSDTWGPGYEFMSLSCSGSGASFHSPFLFLVVTFRLY